MAPSQVGQFPAAALIYRRGLMKTGDVLAKIDLNTNDLLNLKGTPLPQDASFDELRLKDVPSGNEVKPGQRIDPLIHYAGRVNVSFTGTPGKTTLNDLKPLIDRGGQVVRSSTRELTLDYANGLLTLNSPTAQGASGNLKAGGEIALGRSHHSISSRQCAHHPRRLDGEPISKSKRMLLQAMSEEKASGFATEDIGNGVKKITNIGRDPWRVKKLQGTVKFKGAILVQIQPLDFNGYSDGPAYGSLSRASARKTPAAWMSALSRAFTRHRTCTTSTPMSASSAAHANPNAPSTPFSMRAPCPMSGRATRRRTAS